MYAPYAVPASIFKGYLPVVRHRGLVGQQHGRGSVKVNKLTIYYHYDIYHAIVNIGHEI